MFEAVSLGGVESTASSVIHAASRKVDAVSDLFSFGLVLYEMAVGQRALNGATAQIVQAAIVNDAPKPVRQLNPRIPANLAAIIEKALEKDRERRWQTALVVACGLKGVRQQIGTGVRRFTWAIAASLILNLTVSLALWFAVRGHGAKPGLPEVQQRQLTINSVDRPIGTGMISPNSKMLGLRRRPGTPSSVDREWRNANACFARGTEG